MASSALTWRSSRRTLEAAAFAALWAWCAWAQAPRPDVAETPAGDLVADALKAAAGAQVALVQAGALKAVNLPPGPVKDVTADSLLAYPDEPVVVIEMQGERLKAALERGLSALPRPQKGFLQVSGIVATYDPKSPPTKRVVRVTLAGKELPDSQRVRVAMPLSLARGYLGFFRVFSDLRRQDTGKTMQQAVTAYVAGKPVLPKPGERLIPTER